MDTHLKERLVGAAVLVAVAVILIPEMLSGPAERPAPASGADRVADDGGVRTYTIDLGTRARSGAETAAAQAPEIVTPAPPPETIEEAESTPATAAVEPSAPAESRPPPEITPAPVPAPVAAAPPVSTVREAPPAPVRQEAGAKRPWAVQVGSFASQATAERLGQDLRKRGYESFVVPFKTGSQTLYRVRVGPMQDRSAADAAVQKLKREGTSATVVSNT